jgi:hypothetical protein
MNIHIENLMINITASPQITATELCSLVASCVETEIQSRPVQASLATQLDRAARQFNEQRLHHYLAACGIRQH